MIKEGFGVTFATTLVLLLMKNWILILLVAGVPALSFPQKTIMVKKFGGTAHYSYKAGDLISLKTFKNQKLKGLIWDFTDSTLAIGENYVIRWEEIKSIRREVYAPKLFSKVLLILGAGYLTLDAANNLINNDQVFNTNTLIVSGSMIGAGLLLIPFSHRNLKIGDKWRIYLLDTPLPGP